MLRVSIVLAAAFAAGSAVAAPGDPSPPRLKEVTNQAIRAWGEAHIQQEDWLVVGNANGNLWLVSALPNSDEVSYPLARDWIRAEVAIDGGLSRSTVSHIEVDCEKRRDRTLETYYFDQNNLRGPSVTGPAATDKWVDATPGSIRETYIDSICRGARR